MNSHAQLSTVFGCFYNNMIYDFEVLVVSHSLSE